MWLLTILILLPNPVKFFSPKIFERKFSYRLYLGVIWPPPWPPFVLANCVRVLGSMIGDQLTFWLRDHSIATSSLHDHVAHAVDMFVLLWCYRLLFRFRRQSTCWRMRSHASSCSPARRAHVIEANTNRKCFLDSLGIFSVFVDLILTHDANSNSSLGPTNLLV